MKGVMRKASSGFTLVELLIAIVIVAILAGVAIPSYIHYMKKSYFSEVVQLADSYKVAIASCLEKRAGVMADCDGGRYGIPLNIAAGAGAGQVDSVTVKNGVITVIPKATNGILATDTYILTPSYSTSGIAWVASGGGCKNALAPEC